MTRTALLAAAFVAAFSISADGALPWSCATIRDYVAKYGQATVEAYAPYYGITPEQIAEAKHRCGKRKRT